jgi:hypothetical protein
VVCSRNHEDSVIVLQAINFVEEVAPCAVCYDCVNIFQYKHTGSHCSRHLEYSSKVVALWSRFDIERHNISVQNRVHQSLQRNSLAVANWTMEDQTSLPRDSVLLIYVLAIEELGSDFSQSLLHLWVKNHVFPLGLLDFLPKLRAPSPVTIENVDGWFFFGEPGANRSQ